MFYYDKLERNISLAKIHQIFTQLNIRLNFDMKSAQEGVAYAHARGRQVLMAINTFAQAGEVKRWHAAVDTAVLLGTDAIIS